MASSEGEMYNRSSLPGVGFCRIGVDDTAALIAAKVYLYSSLYWNLSAFFNTFMIGLIFSANFGKNLDRDVSLPTTLCTSFRVVGLCIFNMVEHLSGLASIALWVSMKPKNFPPSTINTHFVGFSLMLNF